VFRDCIVLHGTLEEGRGFVSMVIKRQMRVTSSGVDRNGRWVWSDVDIDREVWIIVNVYGPNDPRSRVKVWRELGFFLEDHRGVLAGDFNMVLGVDDRVPNKLSRLGGEEKGYWDNLLALANFIDLGLEDSTPTWSNRQSGPSLILKRLDICYLVNFSIEERNVRFKVDLSNTLSDHYPIRIEVGGRIEERKSRSRYRLDPKWLELNSCQAMIGTFRNLDTEVAKRNVFNKWSDKVNKIKKVFQEFSILSIRKENKTRNDRLATIQVTRKNLEEDPTNTRIQLDLNKLIGEKRWQVI